MHNKPGTMPLCGSTKTGKLLKRIIDKFPELEFQKTNLYDVEYYPRDREDKQDLAIDWHKRIEPGNNDLIVLLGAEVHKWWYNTGLNVIKLAHPASKRSHVDMDEYVSRAVAKIKDYCT